MSRRWKVLLCGYYGMGNAGDEFLASASIALLERCGLKRDEIVMLSGDTAESERAHGVRAFDRWNWREIVIAAKNSETLLLGGGGIFQDSSGLLSPWYYWGVMRIASLCGCRLWAAGQSVGPLRSPISRALARNAFSLCSAVTVRDERSHEFLKRGALLADDLVLTLPCGASERKGNGVLVNFRPCGGLERKAAQDFSVLEWTRGRSIIGVAMSDEDARLMETLQREKIIRLDDLRLCTVENWSETFSDGEYAWGMRLHFGVFCLKRGIPCTLVPYDPKVSDFAVRWGAKQWPDCSRPEEWSLADELDVAISVTITAFADSFRNAVRP